MSRYTSNLDNGRTARDPAFSCCRHHFYWTWNYFMLCDVNQYILDRNCWCGNIDLIDGFEKYKRLNPLLKLTVLQNKSRKFNEWLFDPDHYAGRWHKKNMLRDFQDS